MRFACEQVIEFFNELHESVVVLFHFDLLDEFDHVFSFFRCHGSSPILTMRRKSGTDGAVPAIAAKPHEG
jgi:hypothetical protein